MLHTTTPNKSECVTATITRQLFSNPQKNWAVVHGETKDGLRITITGAVCGAPQYQKLLFLGEWVTHPKYGRQFVAAQWAVPQPTTAEEIQAYLAGRVVKGISPAIGRRIFDAFGPNSLRVIAEEPERLLTIEGIAKKRLAKIQENFLKTKGTRDVMLFLMKYDITPNLAGKIFKAYGLEAIERLKKNPYCLADDVYGIGFLKADAVALSMGIDPKSQFRLAAATLTVATATAEALRRVADAVSSPGGMSAVNFDIAQKYVDAFAKMVKQGNTLVVPANLSDLATLITSAMSMVKSGQSDFKNLPKL